MIETDFFRELDRFSFMVKKKVTSVYSGSRRSIRHGHGIELVDFREYYPGDEIRSVDWKVFSRTERLYIRRYEEEKSLTTHVLVDSSKSMDYGARKKFDYASMIALGFAYLVTKENERFALGTYSSRLGSVLQPKRGNRHFLAAIDMLSKTALSGETNFNLCADQYSKMINTRSLLVVVSDFLEPLNLIEQGIYKIARSTHDLIAVQVLSPVEVTLEKLDGDVKFYDLETKEMLRTYLSPREKGEYGKKLADHVFGIREACKEVGADFFSFTTDKPIFDAFLEMVGR